MWVRRRYRTTVKPPRTILWQVVICEFLWISAIARTGDCNDAEGSRYKKFALERVIAT